MVVGDYDKDNFTDDADEAMDVDSLEDDVLDTSQHSSHWGRLAWTGWTMNRIIRLYALRFNYLIPLLITL